MFNIFSQKYNQFIESLASKKTLLLIMMGLLILVRLAGDFLYDLFAVENSSTITFWKMTSGSLILALGVVCIRVVIKKIWEKYAINFDSYFFEFYNGLILSVVLLTFLYIPEAFGLNDINANSYFAKFLALPIGLFLCLLSLFYNRFFFKWLGIRKNSRTKKLLGPLLMLYIMSFLIYLSSYYENSSNQYFVELVHFVSLLFLGILVFTMNNRNAWIAKLNKKQKQQIFILGAIQVAVSIAIFREIKFSQDLAYQSIEYFIPYSASLFSIIFFITAIDMSRTAWFALISLPTTDIVLKKNTELNNLVRFNSIASGNQNFESLIENLTTYSSEALGAMVAWTEKYTLDGKIEILANNGINKEHIEYLHSYRTLYEKLISQNEPLLIESIPDTKELDFISSSVFGAKSLIASPIFDNNHRIGSIILLGQNEYMFEQDDLATLRAFSLNVSIALDNLRLVSESIKNERYKRELALARIMQKKLLPNKLPKIENYTIAAFSEPAEEVGGDFYDILFLANGKPCLIIGDVSGKGISAAFFMAQVKGVALAVAKTVNSARELLCAMNRALYGAIEKHIFVTVACLVIEDNEGNVAMARAGHLPFFITQSGRFIQYLPSGIGIGLANSKMFDNTVEEINIKLEKLDSCFMISDGVNEHLNDANEEYGFERLKDVLLKYNDASEQLEALNQDLKVFRGQMKQLDDVTVISLVYSD